MNRRALTSLVSDKVGIPASVVEKVFLEILDAVRKQLAEKGHLILKGLGSFTVASYGSRKYHNPHTGKIITIPARKWVKFKMSLTMRRLLTQARRGRTPAPARTRRKKSR